MYKKLYSAQNNHNKGSSLPTDLILTILFMLLVTVMAVFGFFTVALKAAGGGISYSAEFIPLANKPFVLADAFTHIQLSDRTFIEQAIESMTTGSLESAGAQGMIGDMKALLKTYKMDNYAISIYRNDRNGVSTINIMGIDSAGEKCGEKLEGWCSQSCDVGYVKIDASGSCRPSQICCHLNVDEYKKTSARDVVQCGTGICSVGVMKFMGDKLQKMGPFCGEGMEEIDTNQCKTANGGATKLCCAPKTEQVLVNTHNRARVPLLFKQNILGYLTIEVGVDG